MRRTPWRCRHGHHRWMFVAMTNIRDITIPGHSTTICRLVERCERCALTRTTPSAPLPKRPRVSNRCPRDRALDRPGAWLLIERDEARAEAARWKERWRAETHDTEREIVEREKAEATIRRVREIVRIVENVAGRTSNVLIAIRAALDGGEG